MPQNGLLLAAAIVKVFIGALVEAFPHRRRPRVVVVGEGVVRPVVPMPRRRVWHRQAARVAVSQLGGAQVKMGSLHPFVHPKWSRMRFGKMRF